MNNLNPTNPLYHSAPLVEMVQRLHQGRSLEERVRRLRYKRRKAKEEKGGAK